MCHGTGQQSRFFVNDDGMKVNAVLYQKHLEKQLLPEIDELVSRKDWVYIQVSAPSHRSNLVQGYLKERLGKRFVKSGEWPPALPDCNPLDYHFWDKVKTKVYENRFNKPFENEDQLKRRIKRVWKDVASDVVEIRKALKQFVPRLKQVAEKQGSCIKMTFQ